jgi:hypothetical protein
MSTRETAAQDLLDEARPAAEQDEHRDDGR